MDLKALRNKAKAKGSGGFLCEFKPDTCTWVNVAYCHTSYMASKKAGMGMKQAVNFYTSRGRGCVGRFALLKKGSRSHIVPGQKLIYSITDKDGTEARYWGLQAVADALGVTERTVRRWAKNGGSKQYPKVSTYRTAPKQIKQDTKPNPQPKPKGPKNLPF